MDSAQDSASFYGRWKNILRLSHIHLYEYEVGKKSNTFQFELFIYTLSLTRSKMDSKSAYLPIGIQLEKNYSKFHFIKSWIESNVHVNQMSRSFFLFLLSSCLSLKIFIPNIFRISANSFLPWMYPHPRKET